MRKADRQRLKFSEYHGEMEKRRRKESFFTYIIHIYLYLVLHRQIDIDRQIDRKSKRVKTESCV